MAAFAHGWSLEAIENPAIQHPCRIIEHAFVFGLSILPNAGCTDPPCPKTRTPAHITAAKTTVKLADVCIAVAARSYQLAKRHRAACADRRQTSGGSVSDMQVGSPAPGNTRVHGGPCECVTLPTSGLWAPSCLLGFALAMTPFQALESLRSLSNSL